MIIIIKACSTILKLRCLLGTEVDNQRRYN
jgi:hypothetical protein